MSIPESQMHVEEDIQQRSNDAWNYVFPVRNQNYVVMSMVESTDSKPSAIKIYGVYGGLEEANRASREISNANDFFNVYVADTNSWVPIPPTVDFIENIEYQEKRMTEIKDSFTALKERNAQSLRNAIKKDGKDEKVVDVVDVVDDVQA